MSVHCKHCPVRHNIGHPYINPVYSSPCPTVSETAVYMSCSLWPCFPSCVDSRNDPHVLLGFMSYFGPAFGSLQRDVEALIPASMVAVLSFVILTKQGPILYIVHVWKSLLLEVISSVFLNFSISSIKHINVFNITLCFTSSMILILFKFGQAVRSIILCQRQSPHSWPLSSEGSSACHTYCDTGHPSKGHPQGHVT